MSPSTLPRTARAGWLADRPLAVKFGILDGGAVVAFGGLASTVVVGTPQVHDVWGRLAALEHANALVLQVDTRASELKVDGYKAAVRQDPAEQLSELADDIDTPQELLAELRSIPVAGEPAAAVAEVEATFGGYTDAISAYVDAAVADQATARSNWQDIQAVNDITDGAVGAAKDALQTATAAAEVELAETLRRSELVTLIAAVLGLVLVGILSLTTLRSIKRPVGRVKQSLEALAVGDPTVDTGIRSTDEIGQMAAALDAAQASLREVLSSMAASADAVAASSEELSASSAQISASAGETSAQSGVVASAAEEVSRNVQTVAAGAEEMGASIRETASNAAEASTARSRCGKRRPWSWRTSPRGHPPPRPRSRSRQSRRPSTSRSATPSLIRKPTPSPTVRAVPDAVPSPTAPSASTSSTS